MLNLYFDKTTGNIVSYNQGPADLSTQPTGFDVVSVSDSASIFDANDRLAVTINPSTKQLVLTGT